MKNIDLVSSLSEKYVALSGSLNEKGRRLWAATEARSIGRGGIEAVHNATHLARGTIRSGIKELDAIHPKEGEYRVRKSGAGRKSIHKTQPKLLGDLEALIEPTTRGDPESPLRWTCLSVRQLAAALKSKGYSIGRQKVSDLLQELGYSLQANRKTKEGTSSPDRDQQFHFINDMAENFHKSNNPVISVDTKKKELIGEYKNNGAEWRPKGDPEKVKGHDFPDKELGKANPYGVYDLAKNEGWVSVGTDSDTAEFAVESIRRWWNNMGFESYPQAQKLLIAADAGGSNSYRNRLWKVELQKLANESGLQVSVCHYPPGTSKWNKIEHKMFNHISMNWRGRPLISHEVVVNLIANTTSSNGLKIQAAIDRSEYEKGIKISDEELSQVNLKPQEFRGEWNYEITPKE
jgi:hypothetical protein